MDLDIASEGALVRELTLEDLGELSHAPANPAQVRIKRLRDSHHALARALASGMKPGEAANQAGYSLVRVSILQADPAFQELVAHYREIVEEAYADLHSRMASFSVDIIDELRMRFEESGTDPDSKQFMSDSFLHSMLQTFADRTGHGPRTTQVNVNVDLAARLDAARRRAGLVDATPGSTMQAGGALAVSAPPAEILDLEIIDEASEPAATPRTRIEAEQGS